MLGNGLSQVPSPYSVDETVERLESYLSEGKLKVFATIDHTIEAAKVGLKMPPTKLVIFGKPEGGTPVMVAAPTLLIDLPLKALVWEDAEGKVFVSYNTPQYLRERHGFPEELLPKIAGIRLIVEEAVRA